ncbi:ferredoxin reductase [Prauserella oleivorans]|uniref:Ferredoxin reductase n=1 Tax=Prauserella oleivorans TaxID=1478153 RepID=A0ABW5W6I0_9PSEU
MGKLAALGVLAESLLTPHGMDRYLELIDPMLVRRDLRGEVTAVRRQTACTVTLTVRTSRAWRGFTAGQFVRVTVGIDGVRRTRCYSPACSQHRPGELEFTIKADPNGLVSRYLHDHARPGMVLGLSAADGTFTLPEDRPHRIVLISGGSGITPVLSMLRTLADEGYTGEVAFLHYARSAADVTYGAELVELGRRRGVRIVLAHTRDEGAELAGHFRQEHLEHAAPWFREARTYLCGPPALMESVRATYAQHGLSERLLTEEFTPPAIATEAGDATGRIRFTRSATEVANTGRPLLEQAEAAGLTPEHGCRMGICFSCTQLKTKGTVRNAATGETSGDDDEEIQLCISVPVGDVEIDC